jgi:hypothetical protein
MDGNGPGLNTFVVLGFDSSGKLFQDDPSPINNTITTNILPNQITRNQALQISINYTNYTNGPTATGYFVWSPFSITTDIDVATSFITAQQNGVTCLLADDGTFLNLILDATHSTVSTGPSTSTFQPNSTAVITQQGYLNVGSDANYISYLVDGDPYQGTVILLPTFGITPDTPITVIPNPCSTCMTMYPYRPIPYKINRIICREKTIDNTGLENYAFTIDCTSGLQNAYVKKYLLGLGAVLLTASQIVDDETSLQQEIVDANEAIAEYQKGYSDGYSKGTQNICAGIQTVSSDDTFSSVVGDVASVLSVASLFL